MNEKNIIFKINIIFSFFFFLYEKEEEEEISINIIKEEKRALIKLKEN